MATKTLFGVVCALVTPMLPGGAIDKTGMQMLVEHLSQAGVHGLYPCGTNGESISLLANERRAVAEWTVEKCAGRSAVYIQCGAATTAESYAHVRHAMQIGADGAGIMTPLFLPVDEEGMEAYYKEILDETGDFPIYLYNISSRTGNDVSPELLRRIMERYPNVRGVKYSAPDLLRLMDYIACRPGHNTEVLIGCDSLALCCMAAGGAGWVSGPCAVFAKRFVGLYDAICSGDAGLARKIQYDILAASRRMAGIPEIPAIKYLLKRQGIIQYDTCRAPLRALSGREKAVLDTVLADYQDG